jgi:hypothetical protein
MGFGLLDMLAFPLPAHEAGFGRSTGSISGRAKAQVDHSARLGNIEEGRH